MEKLRRRSARGSPSALVVGAAIVGLMLALRMVLAWVFGIEVADLTLYRQMANTVLRGDNIYYTRVLFPYTPVSLFIPAWCLQIAQLADLPFHFVAKWPAFLGDAGIVALLYWHGARSGSVRRGVLLALSYGLNPVSILISSFHGNVMALTVFFCLWGYLLAVHPNPDRHYRLSALSLGIAIGLRSFPVLLVPFFLRKLPLSRRRLLAFLALAAAPSVLTLVPYLLASPAEVLREAFGYSGFGDYGWLAIARAWWNVQTGSVWLPGRMGQDLLANSKLLFLAAYAVMALWIWWKPRRFSLVAGILAAILAFYVFYGGVSSQYLTWILPFGLTAMAGWAAAFTVAATGGLITFYLYFFPAILWGRFPSPVTYTQPQMMPVHLAFLVALWLVCLAWLARVLWLPPRDASAPSPAVPAAGRLSWLRVAEAALALYVLLVLGLETRMLLNEHALVRPQVAQVWQVGTKGAGPGQFDAALALAVDRAGNVYVAEMGNHRVQKVGPDGSALAQWTGGPDASRQFIQPSGLAMGADGSSIWMTDAGSGSIYRLSLQGQVELAIDGRRLGLFSPRGIAVDADSLYVADTGNGRIVKLDLAGQVQASWGKRGSAVGEFIDPFGIVLDRGNLFVADTGNQRVQELTLDGRPVRQWTLPGNVSYIAADGSGRLYVSDPQNHQIWVLGAHGDVLGRIGEREGSQAIVRGPRGLAMANGQLLWAVGESQLAHYRLAGQ